MEIIYLPLVKWRKNWAVNGTRVICRHCKIVWDLSSAKRPFTHAQGCVSRRDAPQYPLRDLRRIRDELVQAGLR